MARPPKNAAEDEGDIITILTEVLVKGLWDPERSGEQNNDRTADWPDEQNNDRTADWVGEQNGDQTSDESVEPTADWVGDQTGKKIREQPELIDLTMEEEGCGEHDPFDTPCYVCQDRVSYVNDPIVLCSTVVKGVHCCGIHVSCAGWRRGVPKAKDWFCRSCRAKRKFNPDLKQFLRKTRNFRKKVGSIGINGGVLGFRGIKAIS